MLKDDLYNIGVDVDGTVSDFFGDDYDIYYETLKALAADTKIDELKAAIKKKDVSGAFEAAHCLKAAVGMCGNEILMQRLVVLVEILRKNQMPTGAQIDSFYVSFREFVNVINRN